jgi:hypothetical protein
MPARKPRKRSPAAPAGPGCRIDGCHRDVHARGLCEPHWDDLARSRGPFTPTPAEKRPAGSEPSPLKYNRQPDA